MSYALRLAPDRSFIVGFMWGNVDPNVILEGIRNPDFDPVEAASLDTLIILDPDANLSELTPEVGMAVARADKETFFPDPSRQVPVKLAVVCPNPISLVTMRLFFGMTDSIADYEEERRTFEDLRLALKWLGKTDPGLPNQLLEMSRTISASSRD